MYFRECPCCGAHLDPGEKCDCQEEKRHEKRPEATGQISSSQKMRNYTYIQYTSLRA